MAVTGSSTLPTGATICNQHIHTHTLKRLHILVEGPDLGDIGHVRLDNGSVSLPSLPDPVLCDFPIREHHSI